MKATPTVDRAVDYFSAYTVGLQSLFDEGPVGVFPFATVRVGSVC